MTEILYIKSLIQSRKHDEAKILLNNFMKNVSRKNEHSQILAEAKNLLGLCHYRAVEFDEAKKCYNEAISLDGNLGAAYYNRGTIFYRLGEAEEALKDMEKAVQLEPTNEEYLLALRSTKDYRNIC